ncbi:MAG: M23 family metallopeptidase [Firmicutes bacterium]|nr:M23 family metallopeptidase [Bacillota bacterium]
MDEYKSVKKYLDKSNGSNKSSYRHIILSFLNKVLITGLIFISSLCIIKIYPESKDFIYKNVYQNNISFSSIRNFYEKNFGNIFPTDKIIKEETKMVFQENLSYKNKEPYKEGVRLEVGKNYLVPVLDSGIIVFMGEKENYGYTIIVQQMNGIDLWYVGVDSSSLELYDYIEKGSLLGESISSEIYLYYQKSGAFLNYQEYLP